MGSRIVKLRDEDGSGTAKAIQGELESAGESGGGEVILPPGRYRVDEGISIPAGVTLSGSWRGPHHSKGLLGTVIEATGGRGDTEDPPLIDLGESSAVRGLTVLYPEQSIPGTEPYPPTIRSSGMHASVMDLTLVNPYWAIDLSRNHELHYIRNIFGCPLRKGIVIDGCTDIGRVENVHFNPHYWDRSGAENRPDWKELLEYIWRNCEAFVVGRSDWEYHLNTFSFGCRVGYRFVESELGGCNGNFLGIAADWARRALLVENTFPFGVLVTNGQWVGGEGSEAMVETTSDFEGVVHLANNSFWGPAERVAIIDGDGIVSFSNCNFCEWDREGKEFPAIDARGGQLRIQGCNFKHPGLHLKASGDLRSAIVMGCLFSGEPRIHNESYARLEMGLNL